MSKISRYFKLNRDGKKTLKKFENKKSGGFKLLFKKYNHYYNTLKSNNWYRDKLTKFKEFDNYDPTFFGTFLDGDFEKIESIIYSEESSTLEKLKYYVDFITPLVNSLNLSNYYKMCFIDRLEINALYDLLNRNYYWFTFNGFKRFYLYKQIYINLTINEPLKNERYFNLKKSIEDKQGILKSNTLDFFDLFSPLREALYNKIVTGTICDSYFAYLYLHNRKRTTLAGEDTMINKFLDILAKFPELRFEYNKFCSSMDSIYSICFKEFLEYARDFIE